MVPFNPSIHHSLTHSFVMQGIITKYLLYVTRCSRPWETVVNKTFVLNPCSHGAYILVGEKGRKQISKTCNVFYGGKIEGGK